MRFLALLLIILAFGVMELLIGGTRLLYCLPGYGLLALAGLLAALYPRWKPSPTTSLLCVFSTLAFIGYVLVRNRLSPVDYIARMQFFIAAGCLLMYLLTAYFLPGSKSRIGLLWGLLIFALAQVLVGAIQFKESNQYMPLPWIMRRDDWWRASGFYISPNHFAGYLEVIALFAFSLLCWSKRNAVSKVFFGYVGLVCVAGIAISGSRGGYISFGLGCLAFVVLSLIACRYFYPRKLLLLSTVSLGALAVFISVVCYMMFQSQTLKARFEQINDPENMRWLLWDAAITQYKLNPSTGTGGGTYLYYGRTFRNPSVQNDPIHVHNDYLHLLAEYGYIGAGLFLLFYLVHGIRGLRSVIRISRYGAEYGETRSDELALLIGALSSVACYTLHSVVDFNLQIAVNALLMAFVFGIIANPNSPPRDSSTAATILAHFSRLPIGALALLLIIYGLPMLPGEYYTEWARVSLRDGKLEDARKYAAMAIQHEKKNPDVFYYAGEAAREMALKGLENSITLNSEAVEMFQHSLALFPNNTMTLLKLSQAYDQLGRFNDAAKALDRALEIDPNSTFVFTFYAMHFHTQGRMEEAQEYYRLAYELDRRNTVARQGLESVRNFLRTLTTHQEKSHEFDEETLRELEEEELTMEEILEKYPPVLK